MNIFEMSRDVIDNKKICVGYPIFIIQFRVKISPQVDCNEFSHCHQKSVVVVFIFEHAHFYQNL